MRVRDSSMMEREYVMWRFNGVWIMSIQQARI